MLYIQVLINILVLLSVILIEESRFYILIKDFTPGGNSKIISYMVPLINLFIISKSDKRFFGFIFSLLLILSYSNSIYISYKEQVNIREEKINKLKLEISDISEKITKSKLKVKNCYYYNNPDMDNNIKKTIYNNCIQKRESEKENFKSNRDILIGKYSLLNQDLKEFENTNIEYWDIIKQLLLSILISILVVSASFYSVKDLIKIIDKLYNSNGKGDRGGLPPGEGPQTVIELYESGMNQRDIARKLNISQSKVSRELKSIKSVLK